jgi:guanylate kinase
MQDCPAIGVIAICGPTCVGKSTLERALIEADPTFVPIVSLTTRPPRFGERAGRDYRFVSPFEFGQYLEYDRLIEYDEISGHLYGVHRDDIGRLVDSPQVGVVTMTPRGLAPLREACDAIGRRLLSVYLDGAPEQLLVRLLRRYRSEAEDRSAHYARRALQLLDSHAEWSAAYAYDLVNLDFEIESVADLVDTLRQRVRSCSRDPATRAAGPALTMH